MNRDETDVKLINALIHQGRRSFREIARDLDVSTVTVANRVKRLEQEGVLTGFTARLNAEKLGYTLTAIINVNIQGKVQPVFEKKIANYKNVIAVYDVTGEFDVVVVARFKSITELNRFIKDKLQVENTDHTRTHIVLYTVKEDANACYVE